MPQHLQWLINLVPKRFRKLAGALLAITLIAGYCITNADAIMNAASHFQSLDAAVTLTPKSNAIVVGSSEEFIVSIYPSAKNTLPPGTITITTSSESVKILPMPLLETPEKKGVTSQSFKVRALKESNKPITLTATFRTGELVRNSEPAIFNILPKPLLTKPHFEITDTKRVVLSGEWEATVGAASGVLTIKQAESKLSGVYDIPAYKWQKGKIEGSKDGNTYRMHFAIPSKKIEERLWVVGDYVLQKDSGSIQMRGCVYHLRKDLAQRVEAGSQGVICTREVKFSNWRTLQADTFMATASFDFENDE